MLIENHGPLIVGSDYWESAHAAAGKFFLSTNAGAIRLLLPESLQSALDDMRTARHVIVSRGPWPAAGLADALELLFDDGSPNPFALYCDLASIDRLPADSDQAEQWIFSAWTSPRRGKPHKALERPAYYRKVNSLPCLRPLCK